MDSINSLSANEQLMLMLLAYLYDSGITVQQFKKIAAKMMPQAIMEDTYRILRKKDWCDVEHTAIYNDFLTLTPGTLIPLLTMLQSRDHERSYKMIREACSHYYQYSGVSVNLSLALALTSPEGEGEVSSRSQSYHVRLVNELTLVCLDRQYERMMARMPREIRGHCLNNRLFQALECDESLDWAYVKHLLIDGLPKNDSHLAGQLRGVYAFYSYLATGDTDISLADLEPNSFTLQTQAIRALYKGDYALAYKAFTKALTFNNKNLLHKGAFKNTVSNYYYALCMLLADTKTAHSKLKSLGDHILTPDSQGAAIIVAALYEHLVKHQSPRFGSKTIKGVFQKETAQAARWLCWMVLKKLGSWPYGVKEPTLTSHKPNMAYLRNELSPTGMIPLSEQTATLFGGPSLLDRLKVKAVWQLALEEIIQAQEAELNAEEENAIQQNERIIYLLEYGDIEPRYQKRLKNGNWTVGKRLGISDLKAIKDYILDDNDKALIKNTSAWDYNIPLVDHLEEMAGCDHLYYGYYGNLEPVNIHKETPFLEIKKNSDGNFSVSSNIQKARETERQHYYIKNSNTDYSFFSLTKYEKKLYDQILHQKNYPAEAEPLLLRLIAAIGGRTEIHSNMVVESDQMEKVTADSKITLRIIPIENMVFQVAALVHAIPTQSFIPGKGSITTFAERDGKQVQVVRSLKQEKANMQVLDDVLCELEILDEGEKWEPESATDTLNVELGKFLQLMEWAKGHDDICEMEWPEGAKVKYHPAISTSGTNISVKSKNGWFEVEGDVMISDQQVISLQQLLELMRKSNATDYVKIGDNEYISLSKELAKLLRRIDTVTTGHRSHLQMAPAAVGLLGEILDQSGANVTTNEAMDSLRHRIEQSAQTVDKVPSTLRAQLRDYQEEGYTWMSRVTSWGAGACLADDMGLGKTLQTIALLLDKASEGPSLVVAPASVVPNWRNELNRFAPSLHAMVLNSSDDRAEVVRQAGAGDVVLATYAMLNLQQEVTEKEWNVVCLDEAHTIKNPNTKMSKAAMTLLARRKIILTGTPIQNHLSELWNLFQFINPGLLGSAEQFKLKFLLPIELDHNKSRQRQLRRLISPFMLRRTKGEVIEELPEKNEINVPVELSPDEMTMYEVRRRQAEMAVRANKVIKVSTLAEITRLRQMACSCTLVDRKWRKTSSKVLSFIDLAEGLNDSGNRTLVFSQFTSFFEEVKQAMDKAHLPYLYLDGATTMKRREQLVKEFQTGQCPFFLISLKAGGLGLNLTGANYVIHLDPWWNPAIEQQATDRAYRIGQQQNVTVYHLISQHTIEEKILRLHKTKRDLADSLLEGSDMAHALTQEELLELLRDND
ncbi:MAG: DEAD/DEAH box helicase [Prevotella sp.]|nr:DEAD/DEAH box helicase [Prevotella sp.]